LRRELNLEWSVGYRANNSRPLTNIGSGWSRRSY